MTRLPTRRPVDALTALLSNKKKIGKAAVFLVYVRNNSLQLVGSFLDSWGIMIKDWH